jgi:hypothetical protein
VPITGSRLLSTVRINRILRTLAMDLDVGRPLTFLDSTSIVDADESELIGRFTGKVLAADIIVDDQPAVVQEAGKLEFQSNTIPNLKIGQRLGQNHIQRLREFERRGVAENDDAFLDWQNQLAENLLNGVRQRMNALICACRLDSFTYNRMGVQVTGSWGKPSNLKVTPANLWTNAGAADPIADIQAMQTVAADNYGIQYNRARMSRADFRNAIATTAFKTAATVELGFAAAAGAVAALPETRKREVLARLLDMDIELEDGTFTEVANNGTKSVSRYLPAGKVELSRTEDDNNSAVFDFGNTVPTEAIVANLIANAPDVGGETTGPIAYYTGRADLNPPDVVVWAVARGFPRCFVPEATAVLTVA